MCFRRGCQCASAVTDTLARYSGDEERNETGCCSQAADASALNWGRAERSRTHPVFRAGDLPDRGTAIARAYLAKRFDCITTGHLIWERTSLAVCRNGQKRPAGRILPTAGQNRPLGGANAPA